MHATQINEVMIKNLLKQCAHYIWMNHVFIWTFLLVRLRTQHNFKFRNPKAMWLGTYNEWSENSTVAWAIIAFSRNMDLKKVEKEVEINSFLVHLKFAFTHNEKTLSFKKSKWFWIWIVMDQMTQIYWTWNS